MTSLAQRLRQKLLDLAIHGKLVRQDANDEPAGELLARIRNEELGIRNGRERRPATAESIADAEKPFDLPKGWCWCRLGQIFKFIDYRGKTPNKVESGIPLVTARNVRMGYVDYAVKDYISREEYASRQSRGVSHKGDILFTTEAPLGFVAIADLDEFSTGQRLICFQQRGVDPSFSNSLISYFLQSPSWQKSLFERKTGTTVAGIKAEYLKTLPIPLPPLAEQKRIVEKLNGLLDAVTKFADGETRLVHLRKKARTKILDLAIRGKLVKQEKGDEPSLELLKRIAAEKARLVAAKKIKKEKPLPPIDEEEIPFDLPKGWSWVRIGDICTGFQYGTAEKSQPTGLVPVLRMGNLQGGELDFSDLVYTSNKQDIKAYALSDGDLLFNRTNSDEKVGKVSIFRGDRPCIYAGYLVRFRPLFCDSEYINIVMNTHYQWMFCQSVKSDAVNQSNISASKFVKFPVPVPPLAEQKRIAAKVKEMLAACDALGGVE